MKRTSYGNIKTTSSSVTFGVLYFVDGKPFITLYPVRDPHGLTRIAKGAKIQTIKVEKMLKKGIKPKVKNDNSDLMWQNCRTLKNQDSNFCNRCGTRLK